VTAVRSLSMRNYATKSGPLKAMPSSVTSTQSDCVDSMLQFTLDITIVILLCSNLSNLKDRHKCCDTSYFILACF